MWKLYPILPSEPLDPTILVVDEAGHPAGLGRDRTALLGWLYGQEHVAVELTLAGVPTPFGIDPPYPGTARADAAALSRWLIASDPHPRWPATADLFRSDCTDLL